MKSAELSIQALQSPAAYPHPVGSVRLVETHISWVLLTGRYAYKIKKPLALDFLDFSTLARRRHYCEEELRLNRRMARNLYLGVVPICGPPGQPKVEGDGEPIEYAVKMAQFPDDAQLDRLLEAGKLSSEDLRRFAGRLASFHAEADRRESMRYGGSAVAVHMLANLEQIQPLLEAAERRCLQPLAGWTRAELDARRQQLADRAVRGMVRECHGDLHLSNLVLLNDGVTAFDCIEFDPALRWTDVIDDVAFLLMDLQLRDRDGLGYDFADAYLAHGGDYEAVQLLDLYRVYRSLVRAKVAGIARLQTDEASRKRRLQDKLNRHLRLARRYIEVRSPTLVLMHGLAASGKSWLAERLVAQLPAFRLRSDLERKRLAGLDPEARSGSPAGGGLYSAQRNRITYARLADLARGLLQAGHHVIVDATFLARERREAFYALARAVGARCVLIECNASRAILEERLAARSAKSGVSEADTAILEFQLSHREPIDTNEDVTVLKVDTTGDTDLADLAKRVLGQSPDTVRASG